MSGAGRSRAATDVATALTTVKAQIDSYESALVRARFDQGFADAKRIAEVHVVFVHACDREVLTELRGLEIVPT